MHEVGEGSTIHHPGFYPFARRAHDGSLCTARPLRCSWMLDQVFPSSPMPVDTCSTCFLLHGPLRRVRVGDRDETERLIPNLGPRGAPRLERGTHAGRGSRNRHACARSISARPMYVADAHRSRANLRRARSHRLAAAHRKGGNRRCQPAGQLVDWIWTGRDVIPRVVCQGRGLVGIECQPPQCEGACHPAPRFTWDAARTPANDEQLSAPRSR